MIKLNIGLVLQPYTGNTGSQELSIGPELLSKELQKILKQQKIENVTGRTIGLTSKQKKEYGVWNRMGLANRHLSSAVSGLVQQKKIILGLLGNCNSLSGMLAGLQNSGKTKKPISVGLVWMDAHGDFNTPETTLSGWLGGMPVAVAAGKCLHRLRKQAGLDPPISTQNIIMLGLRDLDPLEQQLINDSSITAFSTKQILKDNQRIMESLIQLSNQVKMIYIHIDLDILDAEYIPGHHFEVSEGLSPKRLSEIIRMMVKFEKVKALGIASFPTTDSGRKQSMDSTIQLFKSAIQGLRERKKT
ncbi:MAG: hypothetical protein GF421_06480 [Candidatus Aminicenantes bacterium]|nr:hypothetical protein [Candidatus Aminicenantes bacterium]